MSNKCSVCGTRVQKWIFRHIISDDLAKEWALTRDLRSMFDHRESNFCPVCKNSFRTRALAEAIIKTFPHTNVTTLDEWGKHADSTGLKIAEINSCGNLHGSLKKISETSYSEYQPSLIDNHPLATIKNILKKILYQYKHEDITELTYKDNTFDLVLHSETLEHIVSVEKAIAETRRVLKPGGYCVFTVPIIPKRKSVQRAGYGRNGDLINLKEPSFHGFNDRSDYLVCWEFGRDFIQKYKPKTVISYPETMTWVFSFKK